MELVDFINAIPDAIRMSPFVLRLLVLVANRNGLTIFEDGSVTLP